MRRILTFGGLFLGMLVLTQCAMDDVAPRAGTVKRFDPKARTYMAQAEQAEDKGKLKKAIGIYEDLIEVCPLAAEAPVAQFKIAQLREKLNDPMEAFDQYQKLIDRYADSPYYTQAIKRQKELAFGAASGKINNKVLWTFNVSMDPSIVVKWLNSVCDNAPFAASAPEAKKILGDYLSVRDQPNDAIAAYQSIVDNYPESSQAPLAQLRVAQIYTDLRQSGDLSYTNIAKAQEAYEEFLQRYPRSSQAAEARKGLASVRGQMVENKLELGEYYLNRMHDESAAKFCFEEVVAAEKNNPKAAAKAKTYLSRMSATKATPPKENGSWFNSILPWKVKPHE